MFEITVKRTFSAAHAIVMRGVRERMHGHDWRVSVTLAGAALDADGLLCDFHALEATLDGAVGAFHNRNLNETPPFDRVNPTAENVAEYLAMQVARRLPIGVAVRRVEVEEAPGCIAAYALPAAPDSGTTEAKPIIKSATMPTESSTPASASADSPPGPSASSAIGAGPRSRRR